MRRLGDLQRWLHQRWLEIAMLVGLGAILFWYAKLGLSFLPEIIPAPTPAPAVAPEPRAFDGEAAYRFVLAQDQFGPRLTGSEPSQQAGDYIMRALREFGWGVEVQEFRYRGTDARNIIGKAGRGPVAIVGAHYDTRRNADEDPDPARRTEPVPGANGGASGVAALLELARSLNKGRLSNEVWLVFLDAEDNGQLNGWEYAVGSRHLAAQLDVEPEFAIIIDMVGGVDQRIFRERESTPVLQDELWGIATELGYETYFISEDRWSVLDSHAPFLERGIPAAYLIDFDYPYWHTVQDTPDKVAPVSLERVGRVIQILLERGVDFTMESR